MSTNGATSAMGANGAVPAAPPGPGWGPQPKNGFGTASMVLGILAILGSFIPILGMLSVPLAIVGLILGALGLMRVRKRTATNKGAAIAGIILSLLSFVIVGVMTAATGKAIDEVDKSVNATPTNGGAVATSGAANNTAKVGQALDYDSMGTKAKIAVLEVKDNAQAADEFSKPQDGNRFVAVHVSAQNVGSAPYSNLSWMDSKVYVASGQGYDSTVMTKYKGGSELPMNIDLKPGGKVDGWLMFEVPSNAQVKTVEIDKGVWSL